MSAFADVVINDGQTTPVAHTFKARNIVNAVAKWQDIVGGIPVGYPTITAELREPKGTTRNYRLSLKVTVPVLETISGSTLAGITAAPQKAYDVTFFGDIVAPERSTTASRKDALAYFKNLLSNASFVSMIQDLDFVA